jgi:hypothetical protein
MSTDPRLQILLALIENADKFPSVDPVTRAYVPMSITEAAIYTEVLAGYLETKKPPGDEEWAVHDTQPHDATDKAETANKTH